MKRGVKVAAVVAALAVAGVAAAGSFRGIQPTVMSGNPACSDIVGLSFTKQVKFSPPVNGASSGRVHIFVEGNSIGWYTLGDVLVKAAIVKGGNNANLYRYPAVDDYSDGGLVPPTNPKTGKAYDLGAVTFCY